MNTTTSTASGTSNLSSLDCGTRRGAERCEADHTRVPCKGPSQCAPTRLCKGRAEGRSPMDVGQNPKSEILRGCRDSSLPRVLGVSPNSPFFFPQEWGTKGVETEVRAARFLDSRLRGNDRLQKRCRRSSPAGGLGVSNIGRTQGSPLRGAIGYGACRGPKVLCVSFSSPKNGGSKGVER